MNSYHNTAILQFDDNSTGNAGANVPVTIRDSITNLKVDIFDLNGAPIVNPLQTDSLGNYAFKINTGTYNIIINESGSPTTSFYKVDIGVGGEVTLVDIETDALTVVDGDAGKLFNISDITGSVGVTIDVVAAGSIGDIVFISSNTDSPIEFIAGVGLDPIQTSKTLVIDEKYITVAIVYMSETTVRLMGDLAP
jgi:hypothetical protein